MVADVRWDVFLAHASPDAAVVEQLYEMLTAGGRRVFLDRRVLRPGDDWHRQIPAEQEASQITAVLISGRTGAAWYENAEIVRAIALARERGHRVVPVRLEAAAPTPYGLEALHAITAFDAAGVVTAAAALSELIDHPERLAPLPPSLGASPQIPVPSRWFTGRDELLAELTRLAESGGATVLTQTINGLGGVGKTTVAAAFAGRFQAVADIVWWVRAEQPDSMLDDLVALADRLGVPPLDDRRQRIGLLHEHLATTERRWLLVFDNAVDERELARFLPDRGRGFSLVTTRDRTFNAIGPTIDLAVLLIEAAADLLIASVIDRNQPAGADRAGAVAVAARLQGLPLALAQAGKWVADSTFNTWARYLGLLDDVSKNPFPDGTAPLGYERTTWDTIQISIDAATTIAPLAERVWQILGWLAPEALPVEWLTAIADHDFLATTPDTIIDALAALERFSLISTNGTTESSKPPPAAPAHPTL